MQFYIIKTETIQVGYENASNISFIAWDDNKKPIKVNAATAYRYYTEEGVKQAIKNGNINNENWIPHLLVMDTYDVKFN